MLPYNSLFYGKVSKNRQNITRFVGERPEILYLIFNYFGIEEFICQTTDLDKWT